MKGDFNRHNLSIGYEPNGRDALGWKKHILNDHMKDVYLLFVLFFHQSTEIFKHFLSWLNVYETSDNVFLYENAYEVNVFHKFPLVN